MGAEDLSRIITFPLPPEFDSTLQPQIKLKNLDTLIHSWASKASFKMRFESCRKAFFKNTFYKMLQVIRFTLLKAIPVDLVHIRSSM